MKNATIKVVPKRLKGAQFPLWFSGWVSQKDVANDTSYFPPASHEGVHPVGLNSNLGLFYNDLATLLPPLHCREKIEHGTVSNFFNQL